MPTEYRGHWVRSGEGVSLLLARLPWVDERLVDEFHAWSLRLLPEQEDEIWPSECAHSPVLTSSGNANHGFARFDGARPDWAVETLRAVPSVVTGGCSWRAGPCTSRLVDAPGHGCDNPRRRPA